MSPALEPIERTELLRIARSTLREYLETRIIPPGKPHRKTLHEPGGAFVTLRRRTGGQLRGCIGTFAAESPLYRCIQEMAVSAATRDPRFQEVQERELEGLEIEISVLTPLRPIASPEEVQVGTHGVAITQGSHRGVLLPQVPVEHGWDRETFLDQLCYKAGLPAGAWQDSESLLEVFTAEVFSEGDPELQDV